jgi:hypothetical protein
MTKIAVNVVLGTTLALTGCSSDPPAPRTALAASSAPSAGGGMAHGNHDPKYNGVVMMTGNLHLEIVANRDGEYRVYFSDEARQELPASVVKDMKFSVIRPGIRGEPIEMKINDTGEKWEGKGGSVLEKDSSILVSFSYQGERMSTDLPFAAAANEVKANATQ